ncbi:MAG: hypothetical protein IPH03_11235 [Tetrasphaera sp.]|jgi:hypothetical protein|nr:hypothetical protein [Tetrasphaera sp.]
MAESGPEVRRAVIGGALVSIGLFLLLRMAGPGKLLALLFIAAGAVYLNKVDPARLTAVLVVIVVGFGWAAYRAWHR